MTDISKTRIEEIANNPYGDEEKHELARRLLVVEEQNAELCRANTSLDARASAAEAKLAEYEKAQEPVAWRHKGEILSDSTIEACRKESGSWEPLYTTQQPAPAVLPWNVHSCPECGSKSLTWDSAEINKTDVAHGRLRVSDITGMFYLGCDECSETLLRVSMGEMTGFLNACRSAMLSGSTTKPAPTLDSASKNGELSSGLTPPSPADLENDVAGIVILLEGGEWAEHCTTTELGGRLEHAITALYNRCNSPAIPAGWKLVPESLLENLRSAAHFEKNSFMTSFSSHLDTGRWEKEYEELVATCKAIDGLLAPQPEGESRDLL